MGELYRQFLSAGRGNDPPGQPFSHAREDVSQPGGFFFPLDLEAGVAQGRPDRAGRSLYAMLLVGEQVYVLGRPADHAMRQQRVPAPSANPCTAAAARASEATWACMSLTGIRPAGGQRPAAPDGGLPRLAA